MKLNTLFHTVLFCFLLVIACLLQGCTLVATGMITYQVAVSAQEHAAYTDYLFETEEKNATFKLAGESQLPIIQEDDWVANFYRPRIAYADYYTKQIKKSPAIPPTPFEVWKETDYKKMIEEKKESLKTGHDK